MFEWDAAVRGVCAAPLLHHWCDCIFCPVLRLWYVNCRWRVQCGAKGGGSRTCQVLGWNVCWSRLYVCQSASSFMTWRWDDSCSLCLLLYRSSLLRQSSVG
jgi:hypothetical protein